MITGFLHGGANKKSTPSLPSVVPGLLKNSLFGCGCSHLEEAGKRSLQYLKNNNSSSESNGSLTLPQDLSDTFKFGFQ